MRRIPLLFLAFLCVSLIQIKPTHAAVEENDTTWWSVSELLELNKKVDTERKEACQPGDQLCIMRFNTSVPDRGPEYKAMNSFLSGQFWVTSINPEKETFKVIYIDEDMQVKHMGITRNISLTRLYLGWLEGPVDPIYYYGPESFMSGFVDGAHTIYHGSLDTNGNNWIPSWQEAELSVTGSDLRHNASGKIAIALDADGYNSRGYQDYSSCFSDPLYESGMDCELRFSGDKGYRFFTPRKGNKEQETSDSTENTPVLDSEIEVNQDADTEFGDNPDTSNKVDAEIETKSPQYIPTSITNYQSEPRKENPAVSNIIRGDEHKETEGRPNEDRKQSDTIFAGPSELRVPSLGNCQASSEFPWWLVAILIGSDILIMWFFWPNDHKIQKKLTKKS